MGVPQKRWMVFVRENPTKMDDDWGYPYFGKQSFFLTGDDVKIEYGVVESYGTCLDRLNVGSRNCEQT